MPRRSGRVVTQPEHFIGLGEIQVDSETDPSSYNEAIQDKRCHTLAKYDED